MRTHVDDLLPEIPRPLTPADAEHSGRLLGLQATAGNRAVAELVQRMRCADNASLPLDASLKSGGPWVVVQRGKNKQNSEPTEPQKGHDYANNIGQLMTELDAALPGLLDSDLRHIRDEIASLRPKCTVSTVIGLDSNATDYGALKSGIVRLVPRMLDLLAESDNEYFNAALAKIISEIKELLRRLPTVAVDTRVRAMIAASKATYKGAKDAANKIDGLLRALVVLLRRRLIKFLTDTRNDKLNRNGGPGSGGASSEVAQTAQ